jgi:hypothetical protein
MSKLDKLIEDALDKEDRALFARHGEEGLFGEVAGLFGGKLAWWNALTVVMQIILFAGALYAGKEFMATADVPGMIRWGGLCALLMIAVSIIKLMHWEQVQANRVIREVKRVELLIARAKAV